MVIVRAYNLIEREKYGNAYSAHRNRGRFPNYCKDQLSFSSVLIRRTGALPKIWSRGESNKEDVVRTSESRSFFHARCESGASALLARFGLSWFGVRVSVSVRFRVTGLSVWLGATPVPWSHQDDLRRPQSVCTIYENSLPPLKVLAMGLLARRAYFVFYQGGKRSLLDSLAMVTLGQLEIDPRVPSESDGTHTAKSWPAFFAFQQHKKIRK